VEDVLNKGDEISVRVVEVDRERGRIGLRLADDPEIEGKTPEELAAMGTGDKGGRGDRGNGRGGRGRDGRGGRDRGGRGRDRDRDRGGRGDRDPDRERAGSESSTAPSSE
jgi:polyribonucleotide nucleotidyltransferase